jgi:anti-sigma factor RsiW
VSQTTTSLDLIEVPTPCPVPWETMQGDDRVRFCSQCQKNVYQLSNMTRAEAEALINEKEGEICAQFFRRADGTVVTRNCAVVRWSRAIVSGVTLACLSLLTLFGLIRVSQSAPANSTFSFVGGMICPPREEVKPLRSQRD